jgi:hypothetical protein
MRAGGMNGAGALAAVLLEAAVLVEDAGACGLVVTCYDDRISVSVARRCGDARERAALVASLGQRAGAASWQRHDFTGSAGPCTWLGATARGGGTQIEVFAYLDVRAVPGGTLAAGPDGARAVIAAGQDLPPGWQWVTGLDEPGRQQEIALWPPRPLPGTSRPRSRS